MGRGQCSLGFLHLPSKLLDGAVVFPEILALLFLVELDEVLHDPLVKVLPTQVSVSVGGHDLEDSVVYGEQRHVEGSSTQVSVSVGGHDLEDSVVYGEQRHVE